MQKVRGHVLHHLELGAHLLEVVDELQEGGLHELDALCGQRPEAPQLGDLLQPRSHLRRSGLELLGNRPDELGRAPGKGGEAGTDGRKRRSGGGRGSLGRVAVVAIAIVLVCVPARAKEATQLGRVEHEVAQVIVKARARQPVAGEDLQQPAQAPHDDHLEDLDLVLGHRNGLAAEEADHRREA